MIYGKKLLFTLISLFFVGVCIFQIYRLANINSEYRDKLASLEKSKTTKQEYINNLDRIRDVILKIIPAKTTTDIIRAVWSLCMIIPCTLLMMSMELTPSTSSW